MLRIVHRWNVFRSKLREAKKARAPGWKRVEKTHLKMQPACMACGGSKELQVHHIKPFHLDPKLELDYKNLITLCMGDQDCHLLIGHGDNWSMYNPNVVQDCKVVFRFPLRLNQVRQRAKRNRKT